MPNIKTIMLRLC